MSIRRNILSLATAMIVLVAILAGCVAGSTVRNNQGGGGGSPTPTASVSPSGSPTSSPSGSPTTSPSASPTGAVSGDQTVIDTGRTNVFDVAQDTNNLYYTLKVPNNGFVMAVSKSKGTPIAIVQTGQANTPWGVACDPGTGGFVYYTDNLATPQGTLYRVAKPTAGTTAGTLVASGTLPEVLATGLNLPTFVRLNTVGDGLLYVAENNATDSRILRFDTTTPTQDRTLGTFITMGANVQPAFNLHLFNVNGINQVWFTQMASDLTTGANGQVRYKATTDTASDINGTTLVGTGLLNPTDLWLHQVNADKLDVLWTEYDASAGSVRRASVTDAAVRGTSVGVATGSVTMLPPVSLKIIQSSHTVFVARNAQEANGGGFVSINLTTDIATNLLFNVGTTPGGAVNYPFQFVGDAVLGLFVTEFNFTQGAAALATQPSRLVNLGVPVSFDTFSFTVTP